MRHDLRLRQRLRGVGHCNAGSQCVPDLPPGDNACTSASQCTSGFCVDGFCCDQLCGGPCEACSAAKKGSGGNGVCAPVDAGVDPDDDCAADPPQSCSQTGECDGAGACALHGPTTVCGASTCTDSTTLTGRLCDGFGACVDGASTACAPYTCSGGVCLATCADDSNCAATHFCLGGSCLAKKPLGDPCSAPLECTSGFCVDGVCCDTACDGTCQACAAASKASGTGDGTCDFAAAGQDPHDDCVDDGAPSCDRNGACDGTGQCQIYPNGSPCGATSCQGNVQTGFACDGAGTCNANNQVDCGLYACRSNACETQCAVDGDCSAAAYCDMASAECVAKDADGTACADGRTCESGFCVDGVCCDSACTGQCEACDVATALGACSPVSGEPHGDREPCPVASGEDPCSARACDGSKSTTTCAGFVGIEVVCRPESCTDGVETTGATCEGTGECPPAKTKECEPYACGATSCRTTCTEDADCRGGTRCEPSTMRCVSGATCDGDHTVTGVDGTTTDCAPYRCDADGTCNETCSSSDDCVSGFLCDDGSGVGVCVEASDGSAAGDEGGCGCRTAGAPRGGATGLLVVLGLGGALWRSRRRRARASSL